MEVMEKSVFLPPEKYKVKKLNKSSLEVCI
jgi:hypothetical protein